MRSLTYDIISFIPSMIMSAMAFDQRQRFIDYWNTNPTVQTTRTAFSKNMDEVVSFYKAIPPVQLAQFISLLIVSLFFFSVVFHSTPRRSPRKTVQYMDDYYEEEEDDVVVAKRPITRSVTTSE